MVTVAVKPQAVRQRLYAVQCLDYTTPSYQTRAEAEAHLASIIDCDACPHEHQVVSLYGVWPPRVYESV